MDKRFSRIDSDLDHQSEGSAGPKQEKSAGLRIPGVRDRMFPVAMAVILFSISILVGSTSPRAFGADRPEPAEFAALIPALVPFELRPEINERVEYWRERFTTDRRREFEIFLSREGRYGSLIRDALRDRAMPEELLYLAMVESGFATNAQSAVSATGVWQFMGPTALQYGLRIDDYVDERRDPVAATEAAIDYLESLYDRFGSWYLAAAAYNAGPNRVGYIVRRATGQSEDYTDPEFESLYWDIVDQLPRETREYVPRIIASMMLAKQQGDYGLESEMEEPYQYDRVWVPGGTSLATISLALGVNMTALRELNPHLIQRVTPPGEPFALRVPMGQSQRVVAALDPRKGSRVARVNN